MRKSRMFPIKGLLDTCVPAQKRGDTWNANYWYNKTGQEICLGRLKNWWEYITKRNAPNINGTFKYSGIIIIDCFFLRCLLRSLYFKIGTLLSVPCKCD